MQPPIIQAVDLNRDGKLSLKELKQGLGLVKAKRKVQEGLFPGFLCTTISGFLGGFYLIIIHKPSSFLELVTTSSHQ